MSKKLVAVIGANGFVGSNIVTAIADTDYYLLAITRDNFSEELIKKADIVIHSANPARRFNAENYPETDFKETVEKTARLFALSNKKFVLISSLSCRTQLYTHYGRHRKACELIALTNKDSLVVRLGPMFGGNRKLDMLHDIINNRAVYVSSDTQYAYADVAWTGRKIVNLLDSTGVVEIGAKNSVCLKDIAKHFNSTSEFCGINENQIPENCTDGPDANDVYTYAEKEKLNG